MIRFETAKISLQGNRGNNQDRCAIYSANNTYFLVLADGLGGHPKGEVAAQILLNICQQMFSRTLKPIQAPEQFMHACIQQAHQAILDYGNRQRPKIAPRSTAVLAIVQNGLCYWSHVGDSRFYLIRGKEVIAQTRDHSLAELINNLPEAEITNPEVVNKNSITRCLGGDATPPMPTLGSATHLDPGDYLLLCSDGLWAQLESEEIKQAFSGKKSLRVELIALAEQAERNATPRSDNVSALALHWTIDDIKSDTIDPAKDEDLDAAIEHLTELIINSNKGT